MEYPPWPSLAAFILDLDGVVYRGETPIPSAVAAIRRWHEGGVPFRFVTNNASRTRTDFAKKLQAMGVPAEPEHVVGSGYATACWLAEHHPRTARVHAVGGPGLHRELADQGFGLVEGDADIVVVGLDRDFTYDKLRRAVRAIMGGAVFVATNADPLYPVEDGFDPGGGALVAAIAKSVDAIATPVVIGKPEPTMLEIASSSMGVPTHRIAMIGDQVATDMEAARRAGIFRVLVTTGVPLRPGDEERADRIVASLEEIAVRGEVR